MTKVTLPLGLDHPLAGAWAQGYCPGDLDPWSAGPHLATCCGAEMGPHPPFGLGPRDLVCQHWTAHPPGAARSQVCLQVASLSSGSPAWTPDTMPF